jgi:hypothetical protein
LDLEARAEPAQRILLSLDELADDEVDRLWIEEAQRRYREYLDEKVEAIPAEEVFRRLADAKNTENWICPVDRRKEPPRGDQQEPPCPKSSHERGSWY